MKWGGVNIDTSRIKNSDGSTIESRFQTVESGGGGGTNPTSNFIPLNVDGAFEDSFFIQSKTYPWDALKSLKVSLGNDTPQTVGFSITPSSPLPGQLYYNWSIELGDPQGRGDSSFLGLSGNGFSVYTPGNIGLTGETGLVLFSGAGIEISAGFGNEALTINSLVTSTSSDTGMGLQVNHPYLGTLVIPLFNPGR